jgi:hypothetical protein
VTPSNVELSGGRCVAELCLCGLQVLIRYVQLEFQGIKLRILKQRPPRAAQIGIDGGFISVVGANSVIHALLRNGMIRQ